MMLAKSFPFIAACYSQVEYGKETMKILSQLSPNNAKHHLSQERNTAVKNRGGGEVEC